MRQRVWLYGKSGLTEMQGVGCYGFQNSWNRFKTGVELVLKDDVWYEDIGIREKLCEEKESGVTYARRSIDQ